MYMAQCQRRTNFGLIAVAKYQPKNFLLLLFRIEAGIIILELIHQSHLGYYTVISLTFSVLEMHG